MDKAHSFAVSQIKKPMINFISGGISGCTSILLTLPIEAIKVRTQVNSENKINTKGLWKLTNYMFKNEGGLFAFYKGLDSALIKAFFFQSLRFGLYFSMINYLKQKKMVETSLLSTKIGVSFLAGCISSILVTPFDLVLLRCQVDNTLQVCQRRNYKNFLEAFYKISKAEGFFKLWRGGIPIILKQSFANIACLSSFDQFNEYFHFRKYNPMNSVMISSMIASIFASLISLPFDNSKTRIQRMIKSSNGEYPYKGCIDSLIQICRKEGVKSLWSGIVPYYLRVAPGAIITLNTYDFFSRVILRKFC